MTTTLVIFRYWQHSVIAIFPQIAAARAAHLCGSYQHMGQHAACDPAGIVRESRLATPEEYKDLKLELENIGYKLKVISRIPSNSYKIRARAIANPTLHHM